MSVRTTCPRTDNKFYLKTTYGGYNKCILGNSANKNTARPTKGSCLPNCVGYVYGRFLEYWNLKSCNLPTCNAKNWDDEAKKKNDDIDYSKTPSVGSIIVFEGTTYGHVAFVERIEANGDLYLSESNWSGKIFRNVTVSKASGYAYSKTLKCVGFVTYAKAPKEEKPKSYKGVTTANLNCRTGASTSYKIVKTYKKGTTLTITETKSGWGKTADGWVCLDWVKKV